MKRSDQKQMPKGDWIPGSIRKAETKFRKRMRGWLRAARHLKDKQEIKDSIEVGQTSTIVDGEGAENG